MWKSVIYKEWLKIRWFLIGFTALGLAVVGYVFLMVQHDFTFYEGKNYWYSMLFQNFQYFKHLKFLPLAGGLAIGIAQYFPETVNKRIKLAFHLPLNANKLLVMMLLFGAGGLIVSYLLIFAVFVGMSKIFFATEMVIGAIVSVFPWFCSGITAYFLVGLIVLEPVWKFRVLYAIVSVFFITIYMKSAVAAACSPANWGLFIMSVILSLALLFSAYRFRKGEM